jgi:hypothetical protein
MHLVQFVVKPGPRLLARDVKHSPDFIPGETQNSVVKHMPRMVRQLVN